MSPASSNVFFIYYKVPVARLAEAADAVEAMQTLLRRDWPGLTARLMRRSDEPATALAEAAQQTWMEVYEHPQGLGEGFARALQTGTARLPSGLMGPRHIETFSAIPPGGASPA